MPNEPILKRKQLKGIFAQIVLGYTVTLSLKQYANEAEYISHPHPAATDRLGNAIILKLEARSKMSLERCCSSSPGLDLDEMDSRQPSAVQGKLLRACINRGSLLEALEQLPTTTMPWASQWGAGRSDPANPPALITTT